jgi:hypothetical protein
VVEQADAGASKAPAERREGSTPSVRTDAAQWLNDWNAAIFAEARRKREEQFDALLAKREKRQTVEDMPTLF